MNPVLKEINDIVNLPWEEEERFKMNNSDSRSFDILEITDCEQDMGLARLFTQEERDVSKCEQKLNKLGDNFTSSRDGKEEASNVKPIVDKELTSFMAWRGEEKDDQQELNDYGLAWLFREEIDYGLSWLFSQVDNAFEDDLVDKVALDRAVVAKRRNSLHDIFKRMEKRKRSPTELEVTKKFKTMSVASDSSPKLRTPKKLLRIKTRTPKMTGRATRKQKLDPKQSLLTQFLSREQSYEDAVE